MAISENSEILAKDIRDKLRINYIEPQGLTATKNGVTLTNNGDGTYTLNGTTTTDSYFQICRVRVKGKFKLTGTPRNRGNSSLYESIDYRVDLGDGVVIEEDGSRDIKIVIAVYSGSYDNVLYKPMLTDDLDSTYDDFVSNKVKGITMDLLWTNANPSNAFPSQDIKVDTAPYKATLIEVAENTASLDFNTVVLLPRKGVRFPSFVMDSPSAWKRRDFTDRGTQIAVGISYKCSINGGLVENSSVLIPLNIWGIK